MMKLDTAASVAAVASKTKRGVVHMQAETVWTGTTAASRVERIFGSLIRNLRQVEDNPQATVRLQPRRPPRKLAERRVLNALAFLSPTQTA